MLGDIEHSCTDVGGAPDDLVFGAAKGGALRAQVLQRAVLTETANALGLGGLHPHALRHTAASLAIASGANIKLVQQMFGHKSATMTLDLHGHLFPDQLDEVADRMDAATRSLSLPPDATCLCHANRVVGSAPRRPAAVVAGQPPAEGTSRVSGNAGRRSAGALTRFGCVPGVYPPPTEINTGDLGSE